MGGGRAGEGLLFLLNEGFVVSAMTKLETLMLSMEANGITRDGETALNR